ncbi:MAG TPA: FHA domain-containing protein [Gammaproteobacteria bacterium]|nr:FHA domain-containing protein [Gammaproteobacteria bacterium]
MAQLILSTDGEIVDTFPLETDVVTIGRHEDNDIHIDCMSVSGFHSRVVKVANEYFIEDLKSTNHTFVNSDQVTMAPLSDGDVLTLGSHSLKFELGEDEVGNDDGGGSNGVDTARLVARNGANVGPISINGGMVTFGKTGEHVAAVTRRGDQYYCLHVDGGSNQAQTLLNGSPVPAEGKPINPHDIVKVAGIEMEFIR